MSSLLLPTADKPLLDLLSGSPDSAAQETHQTQFVSRHTDTFKSSMAFAISTAHDSATQSSAYSRAPYLLPTDALPLPPLALSEGDLVHSGLGSEFSLTCIHDLRAKSLGHTLDECYLVPKHPSHPRAKPLPVHLSTSSHMHSHNAIRLVKVGQYDAYCMPTWAAISALAYLMACLVFMAVLIMTVSRSLARAQAVGPKCQELECDVKHLLMRNGAQSDDKTKVDEEGLQE